MSSIFSLEVDDRAEMSILGLILEKIIARNLSRPHVAKRVRRLRGNLGVRAGQMSLTLVFADGALVIRRGLVDPLKACVRGSLYSLLEVSLSQKPLGAFLSGRISLRGNPLFALQTLPLFFTNSVDREPFERREQAR